MSSSKYRRRAAAEYDKADATQQPYDEFGQEAQSGEWDVISDVESSAMYQDLLASGKNRAYSFQGGGGFRTAAIEGGMAGRLALLRNEMASEYSPYADLGQGAATARGRIRRGKVSSYNRMRRGERGETRGFIRSIAEGAIKGMNLQPEGKSGGFKNALSNSDASFTYGGYGGVQGEGGRSPAWMSKQWTVG